MRNLKHLLFVFTIIFITTNVFAGTFQDTFSDGIDGNIFDSARTPYYTYANQIMDFNSDEARTGTYSIYGNSGIDLNRELYLNDSNTYSFWVMVDKANLGGNYDCGFAITNITETQIHVASSGSSWQYYNGVWNNTLVNATVGEWYNLEMYYNDGNALGLLKIYDDEGTELYSSQITMWNTSSPDTLKMYTDDSSAYCHYDDVNISVEFDPAPKTVKINAGFDYTINNSDTNIEYVDATSDNNNIAPTSLDDWNWSVGGVFQSTDQNWTQTGVTQSTDYNTCLNVGGINSITPFALTNNGTTLTTGNQGENTARDFDGSTYIQIDDDPKWDLAGDFTISVWVNPDTISDFPVILQKSQSDANGWNFRITTFETSRQPQFVWGNGSANYFTFDTNLNTSEWTHLAVTKTGTAMKFYRNGIADGTASATGTLLIDENAMRIGIKNDLSNGYDGKIETPYFYESALNAEEVWRLANNQRPRVTGYKIGTQFIDSNTFYYDYICETTSTGRFFGLLHVNTWDENSELALNNVNMNFNGVDYNISNDLFIDLNTFPASDAQYTLTFSKTGYGTRTYTLDVNRFGDYNVSFLMLPSSLGRSLEFQVYKTDETTLYSNTNIELLNNGNDWNASGRGITSSTGKITFFVNPNDENYTIRIYDSPIVDYNSMNLTINKPKQESDGVTIDGNWEVTVTGLAWQNYDNLTGNQVVQIYANTSGEYGLTIEDTLSQYFARKYFVSYIGGTTAETLQPYLVDVNDAVSTTVYTVSGYTQQTVPSIAVKIYKTIPDAGRVLVEQVVTDAKGEALISLIANDEYEFEVYRNGELVDSTTYNVTSTSTNIWISLDNLDFEKPVLGQGLVSVRFAPNRGKLVGIDDELTQTIRLVDSNYNLTFISAYIYITNTDFNGVSGNDVNIWSKTITSLSNTIVLDPTAQTVDGNYYDNNGHLVVYVEVTTSAGVYYTKYVYKPLVGFDFYKALGYDIRSTFGCTTTNDPIIPCPIMLFIALFISIIVTVGFAMETGFTGQESMAGIFLVVMGIFTYFAWVPIGLMALLTVSVIMLMIAIGGRNKI